MYMRMEFNYTCIFFIFRMVEKSLLLGVPSMTSGTASNRNKRILRELRQYQNNPHPSVTVFPNEDKWVNFIHILYRVSAHGCLNIPCNFGQHGRLSVIQIAYICMEDAILTTWNAVHGCLPGSGCLPRILHNHYCSLAIWKLVLTGPDNTPYEKGISKLIWNVVLIGRADSI